MQPFGMTNPTADGESSGPWTGLRVLQENPIQSGAAGLALYNELWSKFRWTLGTTFERPYGKRADWVGDLARRLALVVLANHPDKPRPLI